VAYRVALGRLPRPLRHRRARRVVRRFSRVFTALDRRLARAGLRTVGGWVAGGAPVLLLTTTGRHSGRPHTTPVLFHRDSDGSLLLVAANGCADWQPDWFHNLVANPCVEVEISDVGRSARARVLDADERAAAWPIAVRAFPGLDAAQRAASRQIPLIRLTHD